MWGRLNTTSFYASRNDPLLDIILLFKDYKLKVGSKEYIFLRINSLRIAYLRPEYILRETLKNTEKEQERKEQNFFYTFFVYTTNMFLGDLIMASCKSKYNRIRIRVFFLTWSDLFFLTRIGTFNRTSQKCTSPAPQQCHPGLKKTCLRVPGERLLYKLYFLYFDTVLTVINPSANWFNFCRHNSFSILEIHPHFPNKIHISSYLL